MNIRTKVLLGYGFMVVLLMAVAGSSAVGFNELYASISRNLAERRSGVEAATGLLESLERQDSATLALIISGNSESQIEQMKGSDERFLALLKDVRSDAADLERDLTESISSHFIHYRKQRDAFLAAPGSKTLASYEERLFPLFWAVRQEVFRLLSLNYDQFERAEGEVQSTAIRNGIYLGILVMVALLAIMILSSMMRKHVLNPLAELADFSEDFSQGKSRRRLTVRGNDEIGRTARNINRILDSLDAREAQYDGRQSVLRQLLLALLDAFREPTAAVGLDGMLLASTMTQAGEDALLALIPQIRKRGEALLDDRGEAGDARVEFEEAGGAGRKVRVQLLRAQGKQPVGWLVIFQH
ncbi:MAG: HAMP domain-containing protein [Pseudomonadota bacterium]